MVTQEPEGISLLFSHREKGQVKSGRYMGVWLEPGEGLVEAYEMTC